MSRVGPSADHVGVNAIPPGRDSPTPSSGPATPDLEPVAGPASSRPAESWAHVPEHDFILSRTLSERPAEQRSYAADTRASGGEQA
jgi:hypothetical protein